jgi:hypothetical protein
MKIPGGTDMCPHSPPCPAPSAPDREAAHTIVSHPEQGWSLLCNGVVMFDDTGELLPDGASIEPHRPTDLAPFDRPVGVVGVISGHDGQAPAALSATGGSSSQVAAPTTQADDPF